LIICPSCGSKVDTDLCLGCPACGARAVGPPLAKAEHELASYGRAVIAFAGGAVMSAAVLVAIVAALVENKGVWLRLPNILTAGEVAAWRLKWVALPVSIVVLWSVARLIRSIKKDPVRFTGLRAARVGFVAAVLATAMVAGLIGVTIPERLRRRQWANEAGIYARGYTLARAQLEYRDLKGTLPSQDELVKDLSTLPDPDGSIAEALRNLDVSGYEAGAVLAAASTKSKSLVPRGSAIRKAVTGAEPVTDRGLSFTSYKWRLPGEDKILNTDDDVILQDGLITRASDLSSSSSAQTRSHTP
jgi:hypothetical protein